MPVHLDKLGIVPDTKEGFLAYYKGIYLGKLEFILINGYGQPEQEEITKKVESGTLVKPRIIKRYKEKIITPNFTTDEELEEYAGLARAITERTGLLSKQIQETEIEANETIDDMLEKQGYIVFTSHELNPQHSNYLCYFPSQRGVNLVKKRFVEEKDIVVKKLSPFTVHYPTDKSKSGDIIIIAEVLSNHYYSVMHRIIDELGGYNGSGGGDEFKFTVPKESIGLLEEFNLKGIVSLIYTPPHSRRKIIGDEEARKVSLAERESAEGIHVRIGIFPSELNYYDELKKAGVLFIPKKQTQKEIVEKFREIVKKRI